MRLSHVISSEHVCVKSSLLPPEDLFCWWCLSFLSGFR